MKSSIHRLPDNTIEITVTIPWDTIQKTYSNVVDEEVQKAELPGFRKGKAPRDMVEKNLDKTKVYEEVIRHIVPQAYNSAVTEHSLKPLVTPNVELKEATEGKEWVILMITCERPKFTLGDYRKAISELKASKGKKLWVPGQSTDEKGKNTPQFTKPTLDELLEAVYKTVTVTLPKILIDTQVNKLLSDLVDQTKKLGLTIEQYLSSTGKSADSLRQEYSEQAKRTLALEFALEDIADKEGVLVSDDDVDKLIATGKTEEEKKALSTQRYYLATLLRRQKTIDTIAAL